MVGVGSNGPVSWESQNESGVREDSWRRLSPDSSLHTQPSRPDSAKPLPSPLPFPPLPIVQGPVIFWFYFLMSSHELSQVFLQHLTQPKRSSRWCQAPELLLPCGPQLPVTCCLLSTSWLLLWGKCFPSPLALEPCLSGPTCTLWSLGASLAGSGSCLCFWPRLLQDLLSSVMRHEPGWRLQQVCPGPCLCLFWNICSATELLPLWNCFQVIFQGIYQRRKWWQPFLSLGLTCVLVLISLSCTKSSSSRLCTSSVPLTAPLCKNSFIKMQFACRKIHWFQMCNIMTS